MRAEHKGEWQPPAKPPYQLTLTLDQEDARNLRKLLNSISWIDTGVLTREFITRLGQLLSNEDVPYVSPYVSGGRDS